MQKVFFFNFCVDKFTDHSSLDRYMDIGDTDIDINERERETDMVD